MSWSVPNTAIRQMDGGDGTNESGAKTKTIVYKGPYSDLETAKNALVQGDAIEGDWLAKSWNLSRVPGNLGRLEISCVDKDDVTENGETSQYALKVTWSVKSVRNDVSILAYINSSSYPEGRFAVEMWMKETDQSLVESFKYKDQTGAVKDISGLGPAWVELCKKIGRGIESVMRFYPILTKKSITSTPPAKTLEHLSEINDPANSNNFDSVNVTDANGNAVTDDFGNIVKKLVAKKTKVFLAPKNLQEIIEAHQWLKCQDDADEQTDGNWVRTESWMGILKSDNPDQQPWDANLYGVGSVRWKMPCLET